MKYSFSLFYVTCNQRILIWFHVLCSDLSLEYISSSRCCLLFHGAPSSLFKLFLNSFSYYYSMVAAFGSGAMFSLVSGMGGPNQAANAVTSGLFFALVQGGLFKVCINGELYYCKTC